MAPLQALVFVLSGLSIVRTSAPPVAGQILADFRVLKSIPLAAGLEQEPFSIGLSPDGRFGFVNNTASASVSVLDIERMAVVGRVPVGRQPIVMAVHPSGRKLYVSCEGSHELTVVALPKG